MIERLKTLALTVLVILSLLLSLGIWSTTPQYEAVDTPQYANNTTVNEPATQRTMGNVTAPREIVVHLSDNKHTVLFPGQSGYQIGLALLRQASFFDMQITTDYGEKEWEKLVNAEQSLQVNFDVPVHASTLDSAELLKFNSRYDPSMVCKSLYLFKVADDSDLRALFYSGGPDNRMYIARVMTQKDLYNQLFADVKNAPLYEMFGKSLKRNFYLPASKQTVQNYAVDINLGPAAKTLVDSFFVDKSMTRQVLERDNSQIVTDGSRSVRVDAKNHSIEYHNLSLVGAANTRPDSDYSMEKALNFANDHGGFSGQVLLHRDYLINPDSDMQTYDFRQYVGGYPVLGLVPSIYVNVAKDDVESMRRSQNTISNKLSKRGETEVLSGQELMKKVEQNGLLDRNRITDAYLAYLLPEQTAQTNCSFRPVYVVEQASDSRRVLYDASTGEPLQNGEGTLSGLE